jgi:flagellar basal-body rod protein FlgC
MSLMTAIEVGASGLTAQRRCLEVHIANLVNANTTQSPGKELYRRINVVFTATQPEASFGTAFDDAVQGVEISKVVVDTKPPKEVYEPGNPNANKETGIVLYPNINPLDEMVDILSATRSYEANLQAVNMAKEMQQKTLDILR